MNQLAPSNTWTPTDGCSSPPGPAIADSVVITGVPATIGAMGATGYYFWTITLNDGASPPNFTVDRYDASGALIDHPMTIAGADGVVTFADPVMLAGDPALPLGAVTKQYVDGLGASIALAYLPLAGGVLSGPLTLAADPTTANQAATKHYVDVNAAGLTDAPSDGALYARKSLAWAKPAHGDITDWDAALATALGPYALASNVPIGSSSTPLMDGTAAAGSGVAWARGDHVHPTDTSRYAAANPAGYQTAAQVTAAVPVASSTTPAMNGAAAVGTGSTWARADHVHPVDTSRYAASNPSGYQTAAQVTASLGGYLPLGGGTLTGALTPAAAGILGVTNGSDAPAGAIGEFLSSVRTSALSLTNATAARVATITLTAGDWDIGGEVWTQASGPSLITSMIVAVSPLDANFPSGVELQSARVQQAPPTTTIQCIPVGPARASVSASTPYYLNTLQNFASGTVTTTGKIWARRRR